MFSLLAILSCSNPSTASGKTGSASEAGEAYGSLLDTAGQPLANTKLRVFQQAFTLDDVVLVDSLTTDSTGSFIFSGEPGTYRLEATAGSIQAWIPEITIAAESETEIGEIHLKPTLNVTGFLYSTSGRFPEKLWLEGSPYVCSQTPDSSDALLSRFQCNNIPSGSFELIGDQTWLTHVDLVDLKDSVKDLHLDTISFDPRVLLLESWQDSGSQERAHDLAGLFGESNWFTNSDSVSTINPATNVLEHRILFDSLAQRNYLKVRYNLDTTQSYPWVQVNLRLGPDHYDFSSLDSLCFTHRGNSTVRLALTRNDDEDWDEIKTQIDSAGSEWKRTCVAQQAWLDSSTQYDVAPEVFIQSINTIKFGPGNGNAWDLSTIELIGLDLPAVFRKD